MRIGVKYCGGCNSRFDRSAIVKQLTADFPQITVSGAQEGAGRPDFILVINGCHSACASHEHLEGRLGKLIISAPEDYRKVYDTIKEHL